MSRAKAVFPPLGARVRVRATLHREYGREARPYGIRRIWARAELDAPVDGLFMGMRTKVNGQLEWETDDMGGRSGGSYFAADTYVKVWLVVVHPRENPLVCLPDDVEVLA